MDWVASNKPPHRAEGASPRPPEAEAAPAESATGKEIGTSPAEENQEVDVWWGCYAGRTMLPSFVLCGLLTALIIAGAGYAWLGYDLPPLEARYSAYALVGAVWLWQLVRWGYRVLTLNYRLTTQRLFLARSFFAVPYTHVDLRRITRVDVSRSLLERRLGVGRLHIFTDNPTPLLVLEGVYEPQRIADELRARVQAARDRAP
jgi:membrane protein YdbS with pleckstrin-like domain